MTPCQITFDPCLTGSLCPKTYTLKPTRKYELTDHLNNVRVVIADQRMPATENGTTVAYYKPKVLEISDYYPYGWIKFLIDYSFGANAGSLFENWDSTRGTYYTLYRLLDARVARWYQVEPLWESYAWVSGYIVNIVNPVMYVDPLGDTIKVYDSNGKFLFSLDDGKDTVISMTAKELYDAGIQWFEPEADNYMPLLEVSEDITENENLKHFSWNEVIRFGNRNWPLMAFRSGGAADWKERVAEGYFLVTVDGKPYWADAIGNFVFGMGIYRIFAMELRNVSSYLNMKAAVALSIHFDEGSYEEIIKYLTSGLDLSNIVKNSYDYYMTLWGAYTAFQMEQISEAEEQSGNMQLFPLVVPVSLKLNIMQELWIEYLMQNNQSNE